MTREEATRKVAALLRLAGRPGTVGEAARGTIGGRQLRLGGGS